MRLYLSALIVGLSTLLHCANAQQGSACGTSAGGPVEACISAIINAAEQFDDRTVIHAGDRLVELADRILIAFHLAEPPHSVFSLSA